MGDVIPFRPRHQISNAEPSHRHLEPSTPVALDGEGARQQAYHIIQELAEKHSVVVMIDHLPMSDDELLQRVSAVAMAVKLAHRAQRIPVGGRDGLYVDFNGAALTWSRRLNRYDILNVPDEATAEQIADFLASRPRVAPAV